jgi:hypothetical protein
MYRHPGARQAMVRWPLPRGWATRAGPHWHGSQETITLPGPQECPFPQCVG